MSNGPDPRILAAAESNDPGCGKEFNPNLCFTRHRIAKVKEARGKEYGPCAYCLHFVTKSADKTPGEIAENLPEKPIKNEIIQEKQPEIMPETTSKTEEKIKMTITTRPVLTCRICGNPRKKNPSGLCRPCSARENAVKAHAANRKAPQPVSTPIPEKPSVDVCPKAKLVPGVGEDCPHHEPASPGSCAEAKPFMLSHGLGAPQVSKPHNEANILRRALRAFGDRRQIMKTAKESSELSAAIMRYIDPAWNGKNHLDGLIEELADVEIMCKQMRLIFGNDLIDGMILNKLKRLEKRLNDD